ncbi:FtsB family cell division protein [Fundicoccus sp. Sow4_F4]|uniref:FtsB family cell division protein n=1 Tax=Fundicoccus sp. Sow4_F4 TaxID=3438783 RepID=UPI003F8E02C9
MNYRVESKTPERKVLEFQQLRSDRARPSNRVQEPQFRGMAEPIESKPSPPKKGRKIALAFIGAAALALAGIPLLRTMSHSTEVARNFEQTQQAHNQTVQQNRAVQQEYLRLQDPEYLAEIARRDYYYAKPGEIIFDLGDADSQADTDLFQNKSVTDPAVDDDGSE